MVRYYQRDHLNHTPFLTGGLVDLVFPYQIIHPLIGNGWARNTRTVGSGAETAWWEGTGDRVWNMGARRDGRVATSTFGQLGTSRVVEPHMAVTSVPLLGPAGTSIAGFTAAEMQATDELEVGATILLPEEWPATTTSNPFNRLILGGLVICAPNPAPNHLDGDFAPCFWIYFARESSGRQGIWIDAYLGATAVEPDSRGLRITGVRGLISEFGVLGQFPLRNERDSVSISARFYRPPYAGLGMVLFVDGRRVNDAIVGGDFGFSSTFLQSLGFISPGQNPLEMLERHFGFVAYSFGAENNNPNRVYAQNRIAERHRVAIDFWQARNNGLDGFDPIFPEPTTEPDPDLTTVAVAGEGVASGSFPLEISDAIQIAYIESTLSFESDMLYRSSAAVTHKTPRRFTAEIPPFEDTDLDALQSWLLDSQQGTVPFNVEIDGETIPCRLVDISWSGIGPGRYVGTAVFEEVFHA